MRSQAGGPGADWDGERVTLGRHFLRDLEGLWGGVLKLAAVVEDALNRSVAALCDGRADLADEVRGEERAVDRWEVQIERDCLKVLALHQPVASDLRRVAAVLKINGDLERMGDLARHIAKRVKKLADDPLAFPIPAAARSHGHRGPGPGPRQPRRPDPVRRRARPRRDRRRPPDRPPLPRRPEGAEAGDPRRTPTGSTPGSA